MPTTRSNGVWLHFEQDGETSWPTVLLVHGFASSAEDNWVASGWVKRFREAKRRTVRIDCRGHGKSEKPHDPAAYGFDLFAADLEELLRYANARTVDLFGYSMARASPTPERKPPAALGDPGGIGARAPGLPENEAITAASGARPEASRARRARVPPVRRARGNDLRARGGAPRLAADAIAGAREAVAARAVFRRRQGRPGGRPRRSRR